MRINYLILYLIFIITLSGCGIGGWWMEGNPYAGSKPFKPQYLRWSKAGKDASQSQKDWMSCGGLETGVVTIENKNLSQHEEGIAYDSKYDKVESCMADKGYKYIGSCGGENGLRLRCRKSSRK